MVPIKGVLMQFRKDEVIFLLGAGASVDAKIPASCGMIATPFMEFKKSRVIIPVRG